MDPLVAKIVFGVAYLVPMFVIRFPHLRAKRAEEFRRFPGSVLDRILLVIATIGNGMLPLLYLFTPLFEFAEYDGFLGIGLLGSALLLPAHVLFYRSHRDLGKNWSGMLETRDRHTLVTTGIYRRIRHPMYGAIWLFVMAQVMILPNWVVGSSGIISFALLYMFRVGKEERMMAERFGDLYLEYGNGPGDSFQKGERSRVR